MTNRVYCILTVLLHTFIFCRFQVLNYECNFDDAMTADCQIMAISGPNITLEQGPIPTETNPRQPLSDVSAINSLTKPDNEPCVLPYPYPSAEAWPMNFCRRNVNGTFTCPTASSSGQCVAGNYGLIELLSTDLPDLHYFANVERSSNIVQCFDFYYYITDTSENAAMIVEWKTNDTVGVIVRVEAAPLENKWQHSQSSFTLPSSVSFYEIFIRMVRDNGTVDYFFALDEIKIYDQSCDSLLPPTVPTTTTPVIDTSTATTILLDLTTSEPSRTSIISPAISTQPITTTMRDATETLSTETPMEITTLIEESLISTSTTTIKPEPLISIFSCDFSAKLCFEGSELIVTNGTEFTPIDIIEPPRAPLSDVNSINEPTTNTEICKLPYQPLIDNTTNATNWDMWFCYNNQCPTESEQLSTCKLGDYGLISVDPWESNKTISDLISPSIMIRESVEEQCLLYYYYFTVIDGADWGQQLSVSIRSDNETNNEVEIDRLSVAEIVDNRWYQRNVTFNSTFTNYTLIFNFEVTTANRTENAVLNKTIYFALDNIDIYNRNCDDVIEFLTSLNTSATPIPTTTGAQGNVIATVTPSTPSSHFGLILGLSLGLGIPGLFIIIASLFCRFKKSERNDSYLYQEDMSNIPMKPRDTRADSEDLTRYIYSTRF